MSYTLRQNRAFWPPWRNIPGFGRAGRCPKVANNAAKVPLDEGGRDAPLLHRREVALPRPGQAVNQMTSQPELRIGDVCELKPVLLARNFRGLEGHHEQLLFAKAIRDRLSNFSFAKIEGALAALVR